MWESSGAAQLNKITISYLLWSLVTTQVIWFSELKTITTIEITHDNRIPKSEEEYNKQHNYYVQTRARAEEIRRRNPFAHTRSFYPDQST